MFVSPTLSACLASLFTTLLCPVLATASPPTILNGVKPAKGFSLDVSHKANHERDFVRDWAAAHQKWGAGIPVDVVSTFGLADDRDGASSPS